MNVIKRSKKGFALIFVVLIAAAMMIPILMLISSAIPRRTNVVGEAVSDRALAMADSTVDNILNQINTFPFTFSTSAKGDTEVDALTKVQDILIGYFISKLNGGVMNNDPTASLDTIAASLNTIKENVSTYLYNLDTQEYYAVWENNNIANVSAVGPVGSIAQTGNIKNLSTGTPPSALPFTNIDPKYKTDNLWVEIDTRSDYVVDQWDISVTSYLLSKPEIKRTIKAVASRGTPSSSTDEVADGNWYTHSVIAGIVHSFAGYSGLYHEEVYFGQYETTTGMIRSDSNLYMGGWAKDPVFAHGTVYDDAIDAPNFPNNNTGKFSLAQENLTWAKANEYATDGYPAAVWANGYAALYGTNPVRNPPDPNGGIQDKAFPDYYVNGDATIVFHADGTVTINGNTLPMPLNGAIFVEGTATVSGTVEGRCTVGAGNNINIGGNIIYNTPPRSDRNAPPNPNPDLLGLIAHNNILIPVGTFNANNHLQIDAAMLTVAGSFGIDANAPWHYIDPSGTYEAYWNGCQAEWKMSNAPAIVFGSWVKGYDIQHTNYDWNLRDYGPPPFYPVTNSTGEDPDPVDNYPNVTDATILSVLNNLKKSELTPTGNPTYPYSYVHDDITYYYGGTFNWHAVATMQKTALYRISWKEQIAKPVEPVNP